MGSAQLRSHLLQRLYSLSHFFSTRVHILFLDSKSSLSTFKNIHKVAKEVYEEWYSETIVPFLFYLRELFPLVEDLKSHYNVFISKVALFDDSLDIGEYEKVMEIAAELNSPSGSVYQIKEILKSLYNSQLNNIIYDFITSLEKYKDYFQNTRSLGIGNDVLMRIFNSINLFEQIGFLIKAFGDLQDYFMKWSWNLDKIRGGDPHKIEFQHVNSINKCLVPIKHWYGITSKVVRLMKLTLISHFPNLDIYQLYNSQTNICIICEKTLQINSSIFFKGCGHGICEYCVRKFNVTPTSCVFRCKTNGTLVYESDISISLRPSKSLHGQYIDCINKALDILTMVYIRGVEENKEIGHRFFRFKPTENCEDRGVLREKYSRYKRLVDKYETGMKSALVTATFKVLKIRNIIMSILTMDPDLLMQYGDPSDCTDGVNLFDLYKCSHARSYLIDAMLVALNTDDGDAMTNVERNFREVIESAVNFCGIRMLNKPEFEVNEKRYLDARQRYKDTV